MSSSTRARGREQLMKTLGDSLNAKWGRDTVRYGSQGIKKNWKMNQNYLYPCYTTRWPDIPVVNAF